MENGYLFVAISGILSGFIVFGGQIFINMGLSVYEISLLAYLIIAIALLPFFIVSKKYRPKGMPAIWILYGIVAGIATIAEYSALIFGVPVAVVVLLLYTQPLWTLAISRLFLNERTRIEGIAACLLTFIGVVILVNPFGAGAGNIVGISLALIGGLTLSLWIILGSFISKKGNHPVSIKFTEMVITLAFMLLLYPVLLPLGQQRVTGFSLGFPAETWGLLIIYALFVTLVNHIFYYSGAKRLPYTITGIIMMLEPVVAAILAVIFLGQLLTANVLIGGFLILFANYIALRGNQHKKTRS